MLLAVFEASGVLASAPEGTLTLCGPDSETIRRARFLIAENNAEVELVDLLRPEDPVEELLDAVEWAGQVAWGVAKAQFGESAIREAKARGLIVEQVNGMLRFPKAGEVQGTRLRKVRRKDSPSVRGPVGGLPPTPEDLADYLRAGPVHWNDLRRAGLLKLIPEAVRAGLVEADLDGFFSLKEAAA
jgi:hypothetical protein